MDVAALALGGDGESGCLLDEVHERAVLDGILQQGVEREGDLLLGYGGEFLLVKHARDFHVRGIRVLCSRNFPEVDILHAVRFPVILHAGTVVALRGGAVPAHAEPRIDFLHDLEGQCRKERSLAGIYTVGFVPDEYFVWNVLACGRLGVHFCSLCSFGFLTCKPGGIRVYRLVFLRGILSGKNIIPKRIENALELALRELQHGEFVLDVAAETHGIVLDAEELRLLLCARDKLDHNLHALRVFRKGMCHKACR